MASRRNGGGKDRIGNLTVEILKQIRDEIRKTNTGLEDVRGEVAGLRGEVAELRADTNARFAEVNERLDRQEKVLVRHEQILIRHETAIGKLVSEVTGLNERFDNFLTGAHHEEHEALRARMQRVEERLGVR